MRSRVELGLNTNTNTSFCHSVRTSVIPNGNTDPITSRSTPVISTKINSTRFVANSNSLFPSVIYPSITP